MGEFADGWSVVGKAAKSKRSTRKLVKMVNSGDSAPGKLAHQAGNAVADGMDYNAVAERIGQGTSMNKLGRNTRKAAPFVAGGAIGVGALSARKVHTERRQGK